MLMQTTAPDARRVAETAAEMLPDRVMILVDHLGLRLQDFAAAIGVPLEVVERWRDLGTLPRAVNLVRICAAYDVDPAWLLMGTGTDPMRAPTFVKGDA